MSRNSGGPRGESNEVPGSEGMASGDRRQIVDLEFIRALIAAVDESGIDSVEISRGGTRIRVAKTPTRVAGGESVQAYGTGGVALPQMAGPGSTPASSPVTPAAPPAPESNLLEVTSPMVGTFYRAPAPEAPDYVELGSRVVKGQTLCILEAMKLMNELESEVEGVVREICVENAEPVEYGQVLFRIEPAT